jgi:hypothetical protein
MMVFNKKDQYKDWYFIYDPSMEPVTASPTALALITRPYEPARNLPAVVPTTGAGGLGVGVAGAGGVGVSGAGGMGLGQSGIQPNQQLTPTMPPTQVNPPQ